VTVRIVDAFERVEVDQQHGERALVAMRFV